VNLPVTLMASGDLHPSDSSRVTAVNPASRRVSTISVAKRCGADFAIAVAVSWNLGLPRSASAVLKGCTWIALPFDRSPAYTLWLSIFSPAKAVWQVNAKKQHATQVRRSHWPSRRGRSHHIGFAPISSRLKVENVQEAD